MSAERSVSNTYSLERSRGSQSRGSRVSKLNVLVEMLVEVGFVGDVSKEADVENMIQEAVRVFGRLDVVRNLPP